MREVALDTETTGLSPEAGDRLCEVGCVELVNHVPTGREFHAYVNPERPMPEEAYRVHGLDDAFLKDKPTFDKVADALLEFIGDAALVIHNAEFDLKFLNAELARLQRGPIPRDRAVDTLSIARRRFPGASNSLDALCRRFQIDLSGRELHGALLDAQLLSAVYLELSGGREPGLELKAEAAARETVAFERRTYPPRPHAPNDDEAAAHAAFVARLTDPVWNS